MITMWLTHMGIFLGSIENVMVGFGLRSAALLRFCDIIRSWTRLIVLLDSWVAFIFRFVHSQILVRLFFENLGHSFSARLIHCWWGNRALHLNMSLHVAKFPLSIFVKALNLWSVRIHVFEVTGAWDFLLLFHKLCKRGNPLCTRKPQVRSFEGTFLPVILLSIFSRGRDGDGFLLD